MIGRCGWVLKTFHTFFDYWTDTKKSMTKSGRAMYDWPINDGGMPPSLLHITTSKHKISAFVKALLGETLICEEMKYLFVANGLRFFSDFANILKKEPNGKYDTLDKMKANNTFVFKVGLYSTIFYIIQFSISKKICF